MHVCVCVDKDIYSRIYVKLWYIYIIEVTCALSQQMEFSLASKEDQDWCSLCLHGRRLWISESTAPLCVSLQSYMWVSACCPGEDLGSLVYSFIDHLPWTSQWDRLKAGVFQSEASQGLSGHISSTHPQAKDVSEKHAGWRTGVRECTSYRAGAARLSPRQLLQEGNMGLECFFQEKPEIQVLVWKIPGF